MGVLNLKKNVAGRGARAAAMAAILLACGLPALAGNLGSGLAEREYENAVRSFRAGRTSEAFGQFMGMANRGDVDSARIALFMVSYGPTLYGKQWDASPQDVAYWRQLIANSGTSARPPQEFQPAVLVPGKGRPAPAAQARPRAGAEIAKIARD